jgi:cysteine dioxygenase
MTLDDFFARLDRYDSRVALERLDEWLRDLDIAWSDVAEFARFGNDSYRRNLMRAGPAYHALILCWRNGQRSPIHDHRASSCGVRVLKGTATETSFDRTAAGHVYATGSRKLPTGYCCGSQDADIHQISNIEPDGGDLVTLHIYSPPLLVMGTYSLTKTTVGQFDDRIYDFSGGAGI